MMPAHALQRLDHLGPHLAAEQADHGVPRQLAAERAGLGLEQFGEALHVDLATLHLRPGVVVGVDGVDPADEVARQAELCLVAVEGLEGAGQDDPAEVPQHGVEFHGSQVRLTCSSRERCSHCVPNTSASSARPARSVAQPGLISSSAVATSAARCQALHSRSR